MQNDKILVKLSGEALCSTEDSWFDHENLNYYANELISLRKQWFRVVVVCWAWNIWRSRDNKNLKIDRVASDSIGMLGTIINACVLSQVINTLGEKSIVYAPSHFSNSYLTHKYTPAKSQKSLDTWEIVFIWWWTWSPFFSTDSASSLRAAENWIQRILKATKVDWVYSEDPMINPEAKRFEKLTFSKALELWLEIMDQTAYCICKQAKIEVLVFNMGKSWNFLKAANWDTSIWTLITF